WVAFVGAAFLITQIALTAAVVGSGNEAPLATGIGFVSALLALFGLPLALTIAILRYGLYQIDVIINRTVVYGLLAAALTAVYVAIVVVIGALAGQSGGPVLTLAAAVAIALLF